MSQGRVSGTFPGAAKQTMLLCLVVLPFGWCLSATCLGVAACATWELGLMELEQMLLSLRDMTSKCPMLGRFSLGRLSQGSCGSPVQFF